MKEIVDGVTTYANLYTDAEGWAWNIVTRADGSMFLYATRDNDPWRGVVFDTLDDLPPNATACKVLRHLAEIAEGINALLSEVKGHYKVDGLN